MKKNGFSRPLHPYQILSWILLFLVILVSYVFYAPVLPTFSLIFYLFIASGFYVSLIYFIFKTTSSDPIDTVVSQEIRAKRENKPFDTKKYSYKCTACNTHVSVNSKHCGSCNKCIEEFDHHCKWLNNCIGKNNYRNFLYLLASVESVCIINISTGCYILDNLSNDSEIAHNVETLTGFEDNKGGYIALLIIITCFSGILLLAIGYLIAFHVWLKCKGWTTYEYVLKHREKMNTKKIQPEKDSCDSSFSKIRLDRTLDLSEPPTTNRLKQGNTCHEEQVFTFANSTTINSCPVTIGNSPQEI